MQRNFIKKCKVCGAKEHVYFHYGVCTCRACGAFFRRYLANENEWKYNKCKCSEKNRDEKSTPDLAKCKKCRLEKCFSAGMKRLEVGYIRRDISHEMMEEQKNEINILNPTIAHEAIKDQNLVNSLLPIIEAKKRIMHAFDDFDDIFLNGPILFEEIILSNFNIFRLTGNFSPNPSTIFFDDLNICEASVQAEGIINSRVQKCIVVDRLLCVGLAKSMPVFEKLTLSDQIAHLRQICHLFSIFTNTYLAWELGSETWKRKDNFMPALGVKKNPVFINDDKVSKWTELLFTKSVSHFKRASLTNVEFALLIAIILSKSDAKDLSPEGKELLYDESIKYTNILLRYNQQRLGLVEGAQRLDECFRLINQSIENEYTYRLMSSHQLKYYSMIATFYKCPNFITKFLERSD